MTKKLIFITLVTLISTSAVLAQKNGISKVDFKNFTYQPYCAGEKATKVTVKDGEFSRETPQDGYTDRFFFKVFSVTYGDLNLDGRPEAIVLTVCNTGGTGNFSEGFIYMLRGRKPALLARIEGGDRAHDGLRSAVAENGLLVVERNDAGEAGGACCPEFAVTTKYRLYGSKLEMSGVPVKRELYPLTPIRFARNASSATVKVTVEPQDRKRFILSARAGQMMSVKVDSPKISVSLLGDALVTEGVNGFTAKLQKSGNFTIELSNYEETAIEVTLSVGID